MEMNRDDRGTRCYWILHLKTVKMANVWGWFDGSVGKTLNVQTPEPEFGPKISCRSHEQGHLPNIPVLRGGDRDREVSGAHRPLTGSVRDAVSKDRWRKPGEDTQCGPDLHMPVHTYTNKHIYTK